MKKFVLTAFVSVLLVSMTAAATPTDNAPETPSIEPDTPQYPDNPGTALNNGLSGVLPDQASDNARAVLNTVDKFISDPGQALGNALGDLLQDRDRNQTASTQ